MVSSAVSSVWVDMVYWICALLQLCNNVIIIKSKVHTHHAYVILFGFLARKRPQTICQALNLRIDNTFE